MLFNRKRKKIFVIGHNKTGTTSMKSALTSLGFHVGNQSSAELLLEDWARRDFRRIISYCKSAEAFQDIPFSLDYTYQAVDNAFPESKFILTVRNNSQEWYESYIRFARNSSKKYFGTDRLPRADELKQRHYRKTGWPWLRLHFVYGVSEDSPFDKMKLIDYYESHNHNVINYFKHRHNDLLVLDVSAPDAMQSLCNFLSVEFRGQTMPHLLSSR